jgi:hypothetical protein
MKGSKRKILLGTLLLFAGAAYAGETPNQEPALFPAGEITSDQGEAPDKAVPEETEVIEFEEESETSPVAGGEETAGEEEPKTWAVLAGFLHGGGSLLGADLEVLAVDRFAVQAGAGYMGYGAAVNFHFEPTLRSHYLSLAYWHQGFSPDLSQQAAGLTFGFRSFEWLTAQLGIGYVLYRGETAVDNLKKAYDTDSLSQWMLLYSLGAFF